MVLQAKLLNAQQFDLEDQVRVRWNVRRRTHRPITEATRDKQLALTPDFHAHQSLVPALDDLADADLEINWLASSIRAVKFFAVFQSADIIDRDGLSRLWTRAIANPEIL